MNFRGALTNEAGEPLRGWATTFPGGERIEVELRAGRNGLVHAAPVEDVSPVDAPEMPSDLHPVHPEARTTPFDVGDFVHRGDVEDEPLTPEEEAEVDALTGPRDQG